MDDNIISSITKYMSYGTFEKFKQLSTLQYIYIQNYIKYDQDLLIDKLKKFFGYIYIDDDNHYEEFIQLLIKCKAIIAGGFVLSAYSKTETNDLDVYVELNKADPLIKYFEKIGYVLDTFVCTPRYDESFMRKNNVLAILKYHKYNMYADIVITKETN